MPIQNNDNNDLGRQISDRIILHYIMPLYNQVLAFRLSNTSGQKGVKGMCRLQDFEQLKITMYCSPPLCWSHVGRYLHYGNKDTFLQEHSHQSHHHKVHWDRCILTNTLSETRLPDRHIQTINTIENERFSHLKTGTSL